MTTKMICLCMYTIACIQLHHHSNSRKETDRPWKNKGIIAEELQPSIPVKKDCLSQKEICQRK